MRGKKLLVCLSVLLVAFSFSNPTMVSPLTKDSTFHQTLPIYTRPSADNPESDQRLRNGQNLSFQKLQSGAYGNLEDFTSKARLAFKTEKRKVIVKTKTFSFDSPISKLPKGWRKHKQVFSWKENGQNRLPLKMPLTFSKRDLPIQPSNIHELWLDFSAIPGVPLCIPEMELGLEVRTSDRKDGKPQTLVARTDVASQLTGLSGSSLKNHVSIDVTKSNWKEKDFSYLAKRVLGLSPDEDWLYTQDPDYAVLQHRLHASLDNVEALDILFAPGIRPAAINLFVNSTDNFRHGKMIGFADLMNKARFPGDPSTARLNLRDGLKKHFAKEWAENINQPGRHNFYLQEIIIFTPGQASTLVNSNPVKKISFLVNNNPLFEKLETKVIGMSKIPQRLVVDVREISQQRKFDFEKTRLLLHPSEASHCAIRIEELQAVSTYNEDTPIFALRLEDWNRRWDGTFKGKNSRLNQVETPGIIAYLPFSSFQWILKENQSLLNRTVGSKNNSSEKGDNLLTLPNGTTISADNGLTRSYLQEDLLVLEGSSQELEINWPVEAFINEETWFYFGVTEGADIAREIDVSLFLADGNSIKKRIIPNQPVHLAPTKVEVKNVTVTITPPDIPFLLKLREMAFFDPRVATYSQAFVSPLPTPYTIVPKPELESAKGQLLQLKPGQITGLASDWPPEAPLRFSTMLDPTLYLLGGIRLEYNLPSAYYVEKGCPLVLQFNWTNRKTKRQICFDQPDGVVFIPITKFLETSELPQNFGNLQSINWTFRPVSDTGRELMSSFDLKFTIEGWAMLSFADQFRLSPLFFSGQTPIFADANYIKEFPKNQYAKKKWFPLEENILPTINTTEINTQPVKNELFTIDQVTVEPKQQMSWDHWRELVEHPTQPSPRSGSKLLFSAALILLAWLNRKKIPLIIIKIWTVGTESAKIASRLLLWMFGTTKRICRRWLLQINLSIGFIALGPGIWVAGLLGWNFSGKMVLVSSGLVIWGVFCHWQDQTGQNYSENFSSLRTKFSLLALSIGCVVWPLGKYGLSYQVLWGLLPILGVIYIFLPTFYRLVSGVILRNTHYVRPVGWFITGMALYGLGFLAELVIGSGKTYFLALGGLSMVIAIRVGLMMLEPIFRRYFPAISVHVYERPGSLFFSGALLMLIPTAIVTSIGLHQIAEHLSIIVYYFMVIGLFFEIYALTKTTPDSHLGQSPTRSQ